MGDELPKITESGTHDTPYGEVPPLEPTRTLADPERLGFWRAARGPVAFFVVGLVVYSLFSWNWLLKPSPDIHFIYQAEAWLQGSLELVEPPPHQNDWATWLEVTLASGQTVRGVWFDRGQDKFITLDGEMLLLDAAERRGMRTVRHTFVSFPPGPSAVMLPFVALWGKHFNDVIFTIIFASLNLSLLYLVLRKLSRGGRSGRGPKENAWLTVLFGFGTNVLWCSIMGRVWYTALVMGITFALLYLYFSIDARRPWLAGLFLALGFATRTPLLFVAFLFPVFLFFPGGRLRRGEWGKAALTLAKFCAIPLVVGIALMIHNKLRFGHYGEFGHRYLAEGGLTRIRDYGLFNYHFLARNLSAAFTLLPRFQPDPPYVLLSRHGMSLFLTTPVFLFYLFRPRPAHFRQDVLWRRLLWAAVIVIAIPHFFYQNTGWGQFGYRFSLDYTPFLIVLLALGRYPQTRWFKLLVIVGIVVNAFGAITFDRFPQFYTDWFFDP